MEEPLKGMMKIAAPKRTGHNACSLSTASTTIHKNSITRMPLWEIKLTREFDSAGNKRQEIPEL